MTAKKPNPRVSKCPPRRVLLSLYQTGLPTEEIGRRLGVSGRMVRYWRAALRIPKRESDFHNGWTAASGPNKKQWKGKAAGYRARHARLYYERGRPKRCGFCDSTEDLEWAQVVKEYIALCRKCHRGHDWKLIVAARAKAGYKPTGTYKRKARGRYYFDK